MTQRDLAILEWMARWGIVTREQVRRRFFPVADAGNGMGTVDPAAGETPLAVPAVVNRRIAKLESIGLIRSDRTLWNVPQALRVTRKGIHMLGSDLAPAKLSLAYVPHSFAVVDLVEALLARHPGTEAVTERELRDEDLAARRLRRTSLRRYGRIPDALLIRPDNSTVAIELDLLPKASRRYEEIVDAYLGELFDAIWWYCPSHAAARRLGDIVTRKNANDLIDVREWKQ